MSGADFPHAFSSFPRIHSDSFPLHTINRSKKKYACTKDECLNT